MAAELKIGIGADNSGLKQGLQDAEAQISAFVSKVGKIGQIGEQLSSIGQKMTVGLTLPIMALGAGALKAYGDIQSLQKGLEAVMGSGAAAAKEFEQLKDVARLPGLGMEEAVKGSINLQAIGISADKARKILMETGNAVASVGKGKAEFERTIYGIQQLANTDFPLGEDLNIIKDALPQVSNLLKEAFGTSRSDELAKMGVSSKQVLDTITAGLEKLPRVTGGINGAFENLGDSMKTSLARIGKIIDDTFDISGIIDKLTGYLDTAISYFEGLSPAVQKTILVVTGLVAAAGPLLVVVGGLIAAFPAILSGLGAMSAAFAFMTGPIGLVVVGIGAIIAAVVSNWGKIKPYLEGTINGLIDIYNESKVVRLAIQAIGFAFNTAFSVVGKILSGVWQSFKTFGKGVLELFAGIGTVIKGALTLDFESIKSGLTRGFAAIAGSALGFANNFKGTINAIGDAFTENEKKWSNLGKKSHIKLDGVVDGTTLEKNVDDAATNAVANGVKKANSKKNTVQIELPDIKPLEVGGSSGFINKLGEEFDTLIGYASRSQEISDMINSSFASIPTVISEQSLLLAEAAADFGQAMDSILQDGLGNLFSGIGAAMVNGGNIIASAGSAILGTLGQFATMLGKELMKSAAIAEVFAGLLIAIRNAISNPIALLAIAGAALVVGAALTAASQRTANVSGGGGGSVPTGGGNSTQSYTSSFAGGNGGGQQEFVFRIDGNDLLAVTDRARERNLRIGG